MELQHENPEEPDVRCHEQGIAEPRPRSTSEAHPSSRAAEELAQDANFVVTVSRWLRNEAGSKELVQLQKRVRPWWREDVLGTVGLTVRYGAKAIEFEKGKTAIIVPSKDQLVATLDTLIEGVKAGELDEHLLNMPKLVECPNQTGRPSKSETNATSQRKKLLLPHSRIGQGPARWVMPIGLGLLGNVRL